MHSTNLNLPDIETSLYRYGKISYPKNDQIIGLSLREYGEWAQGELDLLFDFIAPGDTVIDIGAFVGTHVLAFAQKVGDKGKVFAFEPNPVIFQLLKMNVKQNSLANIKCVNTALSKKPGTILVNKSDLTQTANFGNYSLKSVSPEPTPKNKKVSIKFTALDEYNIGKCALIKIDVEGMELDVLKGAAKLLKKTKPIILAECLSIQDGWPVVQFTSKLGYKAFLHNSLGYNPSNFKNNLKNLFGDGRETNILFVPEQKLAFFQNHCQQINYLIPLSSIDDLALGLMKKPQYKQDVLAKTDASKVLGTNFIVTESELKNIVSEKEGDQVSISRKIQNIESILGEISSSAKKSNDALQVLETKIEDKENQIQKSIDSLQTKDAQIRKSIDSLQAKDTQIQKSIDSLRAKDNYVKKYDESLRVKDTQIERLTLELTEKTSQVNKLEKNTRSKDDDISILTTHIKQLQSGAAMQVINKYRRVIDKLMRSGTLRRRLYNLCVKGIKIILTEGWKRFFSRAFGWFKRRVKKMLHRYHEVPESALMPAESLNVSDIAEDNDAADSGNYAKISTENYNWSDYRYLCRQIAKEEEIRVSNTNVVAPALVSIKKDLSVHAKSLDFPSMKKPLVSMIIYTSDDEKNTLECLTSILKNTKDTPYEVFLIQGSPADKKNEILPLVKGITYLENPKNKGFWFSCNQAAERARGKFLLILNGNAQVTDGWLSSMLEMYTKNKNVGAVGPKIICPNGRLYQAGVKLNPDASVGLVGTKDDPAMPRYNYAREVDYCSAVCLLLETDRLHKLGGFDAGFASGSYGDIDVCLRLRSQGLRIMYNPKSVVVFSGSVAANTDSASELQSNIQCKQLFQEKWQKQVDELNRVKLIAYYLPQFHAIPENDLWWGKGFTEWTNVTKARPNFIGQYQPHLPGDLGFYDLRNEEVMEQQAELAKKYGIYGFCYYYYWFNGKRLLELPLERMLKTGKPDIPFCLAWANESWTRTWDGMEHEVLIKQLYSDEDDRNVIKDLMRYMRQPNYIRINGKPILIVYRAGNFPNIKRTTDLWRQQCRQDGIGEIYLAMEEAFEYAGGVDDPSKYGFDAAIERPLFRMPDRVRAPGKIINPKYTGNIHDYRDLVLMYAKEMIPNYVRLRSVIANWDNTARRQNTARIFINSSPGAYQAWLESVMKLTGHHQFGDERLIFINAWNEWAEGNHIEPDQRYGHGFLEATLNAANHSLFKE